MSQESQNRTIEIISNHHAQISDFAKKAFALDGRGCLHVAFPNIPPGMTAVGVRHMKYTAEAELKSLIAGGDAESSAVLLEMVRTYDPTKQAVVMAAIDGELPISIKMKLELPTLVDGPTQVQ